MQVIVTAGERNLVMYNAPGDPLDIAPRLFTGARVLRPTETKIWLSAPKTRKEWRAYYAAADLCARYGCELHMGSPP